MKVEKITDDSLRVWLTDEEMQRWGLSARQPENTAKAQRLVRRALHTAHMPPVARISAELIPVEGGGVLLLSPWRHTTAGTTSGTRVYRIRDTDALCELALRWCRMPSEQPPPETALYAQGREYDLVVTPLVPLTEEKIRLLEEYARWVGDTAGAVAAAAEYGRPLGQGNVLERLGVTDPAPAAPNRQERGR